MPSKTISNINPLQKLLNCAPDYHFLKVLGCACYPWLHPYSNHKLDFRSIPCIFNGYAIDHKGYRCLDPKIGRVYISRHVIFDEQTFTYKEQPEQPSLQSPSPSLTCLLMPPLSIPFQPHPNPATSQPPSPDPPNPPPSPPQNTPNSNPPPRTPHPPSKRTKPPIQPHTMQIRSKSRIYKPKAYTATHPFHSTLLTTKIHPFVPKTFKQASKHSHWLHAMKTEIQALHHTNTWTFVPPNPSQNLVGCKWVFRVKHKQDGSVERYRARLVAKGFHQQQGLDYTETFSP
ncbi:hypothetical protein M0R45_036192 [Rubus argutus]|uniref:Reverse transcriptase Ty1/copia-type domain-containing protein n=1 Tax=Rubus argutus TaxID=59490 RepID=A0AAW1VVD4_RUBAR